MATTPDPIFDILHAQHPATERAAHYIQTVATSAVEKQMESLRDEMDKRFEKVEGKIESIEGQVEEANVRLARIEEKTDSRFDTVLQAVLDQNKAANQGSFFMNPSVQIIAAIAILMLLAGAIGKDFIITTPVVDVTTTDGP